MPADEEEAVGCVRSAQQHVSFCLLLLEYMINDEVGFFFLSRVEIGADQQNNTTTKLATQENTYIVIIT